MDASTPGLSYALLFVALLPVIVRGSQNCVPRAIPDTVIDINQAVARGARFTDPLRVSSEEECVSACCVQRDRGGDRSCNLLVFDARKGPGFQNCYIFHCPTETSCPLSHSPGVRTYSLWTETSSSGKQGLKSSDRSKSSGSAIASQGSAIHHTQEEEASKSITSQILHLADKMDQHLEKMESESDLLDDQPPPTTAMVPPRTTTTPMHKAGKKAPPDAKGAKPGRVSYKKPDSLKVYYPTEASMSAGTIPRLGTSAPQPVPPAASRNVSAAKKVSAESGHVTAVTPKVNGPHTESPALTTGHQTHPAPIREGHPPPQGEPASKDAPRRAEAAGAGVGLPSLEDKSGLVAALVFGLLFLIMVIGLVSRKVSEARRRHRYTKLDYLINGMYVDT